MKSNAANRQLRVKSVRLLIPCVAAALAVTGLAGCELNRAAATRVEEALAAYERMAPRDAESFSAAAWRAPAGQGEPATPQAATLRQLIRDALRDNPAIAAAAERARADAAHVPKVTALPDPMLMTKTLPEPIRTAEGDNYFVLGVQQKLIVPDKLDRAGQAALHELEMALATLDETRLRVIAEVKRAYFTLYVVDRTIAIDRTNQDLLRGLIDVARSQSTVGQRSQGDVLRAQVELSSLESRIIELKQARRSTVARLNMLLNRPAESAMPAAEDFDLRAVEGKVERLFAAAEEANPQLRRVREQIERDRERVELAKLAWWPDFTLGFEWMSMDPRGAFEPRVNPQTGMRPRVSQMSEGGSDNWAITFGFNVPIWYEKVAGGIREARQRLLASQHELTARRNQVRFEIEDALARVRAQQELAVLFRDTIIPQAQQAYEVSRAAYTSGAVQFLTVIDNWQKWLTFNIQYHRALGELERSMADLEMAVGRCISEFGDKP